MKVDLLDFAQGPNRNRFALLGCQTEDIIADDMPMREGSHKGVEMQKPEFAMKSEPSLTRKILDWHVLWVVDH